MRVAFVAGLQRARQCKRIVLWLYLVNVAFAATLLFPFRRLAEKVSRTDLADGLVSGFDLNRFIDIWQHHEESLRSLAHAAVGLGAVYLLIQIIITGGIVASLAEQRRPTLRRFLQLAGRYAWRFLRMFILLVAVTAGVVALYRSLLSEYVERLRADAISDVTAFFWRAVVIACAAAVAIVVAMLFDYAKIRVVLEGRRSVLRAWLAAVGFCLRRPIETLALFGLNVLIVVLLSTVYLWADYLLPTGTYAGLIGLVFVQQLYVASRIGMKLVFFATQMEYFRRATTPRPESRAAVPRRVAPARPARGPSTRPPGSGSPAPATPPAPQPSRHRAAGV